MTVSFDNSIGTPPLAEAIDRHPLTAAPDNCLLDVVKLMHDTAEHAHQPLGNL
jgi:CBS domain-containing protein